MFQKDSAVFLGIMVFFCVAGIAQAAQPPQPPPRFQEVEGSHGSIVRDSKTGLEWQRCPYGQSWTGSGCNGEAWRGSWEDALRLTAPGGFRLPTISELRTLAPYDHKALPGDYWFWSSSASADFSHLAWCLLFNNGFVSADSKKATQRVRLVRGGQ